MQSAKGLPMIKGLLRQLQHDVMMWVALAVALVTMLISRPRLSDVNWQTIASLAALMAVVQVFERLHVLDALAARLIAPVKHQRQLVQVLLVLAFFSAMLLTNDVAIITLVPLLVMISEMVGFSAVMPTVLIAMAANLGSLLTPMGNPQNLFLLTHYHLSLGHFLQLSWPISVASALLLWGLSWLIPKRQIERPQAVSVQLNGRLVSIAGVATIVILLGIFSLIPLWVMGLVALGLLVLIDWRLIVKIDYGLLLTFIGFFIAVGNLSRASWIAGGVQQLVHTPLTTYLSALGLSQFISNVPATILLAKFTNQVHALFLGVNVGGLGTLVASLANLLAYKAYQNRVVKPSGRYLRVATVLNFGALLILGLVGWGLLQLAG